METKMVEIKEMSFSYRRKEKKIYENFSLSFEKSSIYGLLGKNGTGKTTLLYLMCGLLRPQSGEIAFKEKNIAYREVELLQDLFILPEEFFLPDIELEKFIKIYSVFYPKFSMETFKSCLEDFEMDRNVHLKELSMGQKKKIFISFAVATNTSLLLMDEPSNGLDIPSKSQFRKIIASNMSNDKLMIISTHQVRDIDTLLDHVTIIDGNDILLNRSIVEIGERLVFEEVPAGEKIDDALFSQTSVRGSSIVRPNSDQEETPLNLEVLFNATLTERDKIKNLFD